MATKIGKVTPTYYISNLSNNILHGNSINYNSLVGLIIWFVMLVLALGISYIFTSKRIGKTNEEVSKKHVLFPSYVGLAPYFWLLWLFPAVSVLLTLPTIMRNITLILLIIFVKVYRDCF